MLRTRVETDRDQYKHWQTQGEWRFLDAPWEQSVTEEKKDKVRVKKQVKAQDDTLPKELAMIATLENKLLGWVSRYCGKDNLLVWFVGIDICEDDFLNRGYGTEALNLWVDYQFSNSEYHKLGLDTWSFNPRMMRVAEKVGFLFEGRQREMQLWQGEWQDLMHFGMLREEWEKAPLRENFRNSSSLSAPLSTK
jgi:RimJ/RimL family protein N-acetyltransferase